MRLIVEWKVGEGRKVSRFFEMRTSLYIISGMEMHPYPLARGRNNVRMREEKAVVGGWANLWVPHWNVRWGIQPSWKIHFVSVCREVGRITEDYLCL
mmetsp:Transcript_14226/g.29272  ORF Transcript_14226/g.29272 Transcript_14226/m.29272 type:complete len:97 (+) Transcript_14226:116-406(+)